MQNTPTANPLPIQSALHLKQYYNPFNKYQSTEFEFILYNDIVSTIKANVIVPNNNYLVFSHDIRREIRFFIALTHPKNFNLQSIPYVINHYINEMIILTQEYINEFQYLYDYVILIPSMEDFMNKRQSVPIF